jgi:hypothetical protein
MSPSHFVHSAVYAQSPLRNITTHDDQSPTQSASAARQSRNSRRISLRDALSNVLGSGVPVELLPNPPRRTSSSLSSDRTSNTSSPAESRRSSGTFFKEETTSSPVENAVDSASLKVESDGKMPPVEWSLEDAVYATPAGKGGR